MEILSFRSKVVFRKVYAEHLGATEGALPVAILDRWSFVATGKRMPR